MNSARIGLYFYPWYCGRKWKELSRLWNINSWNEWFEDTSIEPVGYFPEMKIPDYFGQSNNVGMSTRRGNDMRVPDKIVIYDKHGHTWIDTPESIKKVGIDIAQGYEWPCYGFDYLFALRDCFSISYKGIDGSAHDNTKDSQLRSHHDEE